MLSCKNHHSNSTQPTRARNSRTLLLPKAEINKIKYTNIKIVFKCEDRIYETPFHIKNRFNASLIT